MAHDQDELVGARGLHIVTVSYRGDRNADYRISRFSEITKIVERRNAKN